MPTTSCAQRAPLGASKKTCNAHKVSECFKQILEKYKRAPDIVVNSAGITKDGFLLRMKEEDFDQVMLGF